MPILTRKQMERVPHLLTEAIYHTIEAMHPEQYTCVYHSPSRLTVRAAERSERRQEANILVAYGKLDDVDEDYLFRKIKVWLGEIKEIEEVEDKITIHHTSYYEKPSCLVDIVLKMLEDTEYEYILIWKEQEHIVVSGDDELPPEVYNLKILPIENWNTVYDDSGYIDYICVDDLEHLTSEEVEEYIRVDNMKWSSRCNAWLHKLHHYPVYLDDIEDEIIEVSIVK